MKRLLFLLLAFAVAGATMSCEKEYLPARDNTNEDVSNPTPEKSGVKSEILGCWTVTAESEAYDIVEESSLYFWEDGSGYLANDSSRLDGSYVGLNRSGFEWYVEGDNLYLTYPREEPIMITYSIEHNTLTLVSEDNGVKYETIFNKQKEADHRFMGDWDITKKVGDKYHNEHIKFVTPRDCYTYYFVYTDPNLPPTEGNVRPVWYKYEFDDNTITMTNVQYGGTSKKEYKIEGTKLYLNGERYSNFKKENGFE